MFPFVYETSLGMDAYFVFFSDIRLSERDCSALSIVTSYIDELRDMGKAEYLEHENVYVSYVSLEELKKAIEELD
jgi:hypothetical protein